MKNLWINITKQLDDLAVPVFPDIVMIQLYYQLITNYLVILEILDLIFWQRLAYIQYFILEIELQLLKSVCLSLYEIVFLFFFVFKLIGFSSPQNSSIYMLFIQFDIFDFSVIFVSFLVLLLELIQIQTKVFGISHLSLVKITFDIDDPVFFHHVQTFFMIAHVGLQ